MEQALYEKVLADLKLEMAVVVKRAVDEALLEIVKPVHKKLDSIQEVADYNRTEATDIGRDISDIKVTESETVATLRELLSGVHKQSRNVVQTVTTTVETQLESIADKVEDVVSPAIEKTMDKFVARKGDKFIPKRPRHRFRLPFFTRN